MTETKECDDRTTRVKNVKLRTAEGVQRRMLGELENEESVGDDEKDLKIDDDDEKGSRPTDAETTTVCTLHCHAVTSAQGSWA